MLDFGVFTVGNLRKEDCVETLSVEVLLIPWVLKVILTRSWVFLRG